MTNYSVLLGPQPKEFLDAIDDKSERIVKDHLEYLEDNPYPGRGRGDKKGEVVDGEDVYRIHISRTFTAIYDILEEDKEVRVVEILDIGDAHKRYGF